MSDRQLLVTQVDAERLRALLREREGTAHDQAHLGQLALELERAIEIDPADVPYDVITMHSRVRVLELESGGRTEFTLVYPGEADVAEHRISVLAPFGTAVLGYRAGDEIVWGMPGGIRRLRVERVWPPERSGSSPPGATAMATASLGMA